MPEATHEPFVNRGPHYPSELVNTDFPSEQEFKHHVSIARPYRKQHFGSFISRFQVLEFASNSVSSRTLQISAALRNAAAVFGLLLLVEWAIGQVTQSLSGLVGTIESVTLMLTLACVLVSVVGPLSEFLAAMSFARFALGRRPPEPIDLAVRFGNSPLRKAELSLYGRSVVRFNEFKTARTIWLGNGEVQFGCGPKGISIEHDYGFLYLLRWEKIELIYDSDRIDHPPFDEVYGVQLFINSGRGNWSPNPNTPFFGDLQELERLGREMRREARRYLTWAPRSIRVRLASVDVDPTIPVDELVIPKQYFEEAEHLRWEDFMLACWEYKYFPDEGAGGKSVGTIDFREHHEIKAKLEAGFQTLEGVARLDSPQPSIKKRA